MKLKFVSPKLEQEVRTGLLLTANNKTYQLAENFEIVEPAASKSKYNDYFGSITPSPFGKEEALFCLHCATVRDIKKYHIIKCSTTSSKTTHMNYSHQPAKGGTKNMKKAKAELWLKETNEIKAKVPNKKITHKPKVDKVNLVSMFSESRSNGTELGFHKVTTKKRDALRFSGWKYNLAKWVLLDERPANLVSSQNFKRLIGQVNSSVKVPSRNTVKACEKIICGFTMSEVRARLNTAAVYFGNNPFIALQADVWTSKSLKSFLGISCTFYDCVSDSILTLVLYCAPLKRGKTETDLTVLLTSTLRQMGIEPSWILQTISDHEKSMENSLSNTYKKASHRGCFAHEEQTYLRHCCAFPDKEYKKDRFKEGFAFWKKVRNLVRYFTKSAKRTRRLMNLQDTAQEGNRRGYKVGMKKFSGTRWSGALLVLLRLIRLEKQLGVYFTNDFNNIQINLNPLEWRTVTELAALLEPFGIMNKVMQFKNRCVSATKFCILDLLQSHLKLAQETVTNDRVTLEFNGEKKWYQTRITTPVAMLTLQRMLKRFDDDFGLYMKMMKGAELSEVEQNEVNQNLDLQQEVELDQVALFLDPRFRDWYFAKINREQQEKVIAAAKSLHIESTTENKDTVKETGSSNKRGLEQKQNPSPRSVQSEKKTKLNFADRFQFQSHSQSLSQSSEVNNEGNDDPLSSFDVYANVKTGFGENSGNILSRILDHDHEKYCPLKWWTRKEEQMKNLEVVAKVARKVLALQISSSFSESQFSHATFVTSGRRNRTGIEYLNIKQFVRFNFHLVEKRFDQEKYTFDEPNNRRKYNSIVNELHQGFEINVQEALVELGLDEEEQETYEQAKEAKGLLSEEEEEDNVYDSDLGYDSGNSDEEEQQTTVGKEKDMPEEKDLCRKCGSYSMVKLAAKDFDDDVLKCSVKECKETIGRNDHFWGCTQRSCEQYDECCICHEASQAILNTPFVETIISTRSGKKISRRRR